MWIPGMGVFCRRLLERKENWVSSQQGWVLGGLTLTNGIIYGASVICQALCFTDIIAKLERNLLFSFYRPQTRSTERLNYSFEAEIRFKIKSGWLQRPSSFLYPSGCPLEACKLILTNLDHKNFVKKKKERNQCPTSWNCAISHKKLNFWLPFKYWKVGNPGPMFLWGNHWLKQSNSCPI